MALAELGELHAWRPVRGLLEVIRLRIVRCGWGSGLLEQRHRMHAGNLCLDATQVADFALAIDILRPIAVSGRFRSRMLVMPEVDRCLRWLHAAIRRPSGERHLQRKHEHQERSDELTHRRIMTELPRGAIHALRKGFRGLPLSRNSRWRNQSRGPESLSPGA